jgi:phage terminase small subunit
VATKNRKPTTKRKRIEKRKRAKLPPRSARHAPRAAGSPPSIEVEKPATPPAPLVSTLPPEAGDLPPKHRRFVIEYLVDQNGKRAAIRSGYSPLSAESTASVILSDPKVRAAVDAALEQRAQEAGASVAEVMLLLTRIAKADLRRVVDEYGRTLPLHEIPEDLAAAISSIEVEELFGTVESVGPRGGTKKERVQFGYTTKVKLWDKNKAAELLGKHLRMWKDSLALTGPDGGPIETKGSAEDMARIDALLGKVEALIHGGDGARAG